MEIIKIKNLEEATAIFRKIGVDTYGIGAMAPKTININILLEKQPCKIANIIKQEMLSLGGDAAVARESVSCSISASDILIMGTVKQIFALAEIEKQPFGLNLIARDISGNTKKHQPNRICFKNIPTRNCSGQENSGDGNFECHA